MLMKATAITDIGKTRAVNHDYIYTSVDRVGCLPNLFIVADGMGGHKAGDTASRFTVETIKTLIEQSQEKDAISVINDSVKMVNSLLLQKASESEDYYGMGTTLVIATIYDNVLRVANVGDSRLYVIDDNDITQITRDHSLVEEMVLAGKRGKNTCQKECHNKGNRRRGTSRTRDVFNRSQRKQQDSYVFRWSYQYARRCRNIKHSKEQC